MDLIKQVLLLVHFMFAKVSACPTDCHCQSLSSGLNVDCSKRGLRNLPAGIPANTAKLYLYDNEIESLKEDVFSHVTSLRELYLYNNKIATLQSKIFRNNTDLEILHIANNSINYLEDDVFYDLKRLRELHLQQNNITALPINIFQHLDSLEFLYLYDNEIKIVDENHLRYVQGLKELYLQNNKIESLPVSLFSSLASLQVLDFSTNLLNMFQPFTFFNISSLKKLYLHSNHIESLTENTFVNLESIEQLDLYDNKITTIERSSFVNLPKLTILQLHFNEISCDCNIRWFRAWLLSKPSIGTAEAVCKTSGIYITELSDDVFSDCDKVELHLEENVSCNRDKRTYVECILEGPSGTSSTWFHYRHDILFRSITGRIHGNTNTLLFDKCTSDDAGQYVCSWNTNSPETPSINKTTWVTINVDIGLQEMATCDTSSSIEFACNLTSTEAVPNDWTHSINGVIIRRLPGNFEDQQNILTVPICNIQDSGRYACSWSGDVYGLNISNSKSNLQIYGPPIIHRSDSNIIANSRTINLWFTSNPPASTIKWTHGNISLANNLSYEVSTIHSELLLDHYGVEVKRNVFLHTLEIHEFNPSKAGEYVCRLTNKYGSVEKTFYINEAEGTPIDKNDNMWITVLVIALTLVVVIPIGVVILVLTKKKKKNGIQETSQERPREHCYDTPRESDIPNNYDSLEVYDYIDVASSSSETEPKRISYETSTGQVELYNKNNMSGYLNRGFVDNSQWDTTERRETENQENLQSEARNFNASTISSDSSDSSSGYNIFLNISQTD